MRVPTAALVSLMLAGCGGDAAEIKRLRNELVEVRAKLLVAETQLAELKERDAVRLPVIQRTPARDWAEFSPVVVTAHDFVRLTKGMSVDEVVEVIGDPGEETTRVGIGDFEAVNRNWSNPDNSTVMVTFENGRLSSKSHFGLSGVVEAERAFDAERDAERQRLAEEAEREAERFAKMDAERQAKEDAIRLAEDKRRTAIEEARIAEQAREAARQLAERQKEQDRRDVLGLTTIGGLPATTAKSSWGYIYELLEVGTSKPLYTTDVSEVKNLLTPKQTGRTRATAYKYSGAIGLVSRNVLPGAKPLRRYGSDLYFASVPDGISKAARDNSVDLGIWVMMGPGPNHVPVHSVVDVKWKNQRFFTSKADAEKYAQHLRDFVREDVRVTEGVFYVVDDKLSAAP